MCGNIGGKLEKSPASVLSIFGLTAQGFWRQDKNLAGECHDAARCHGGRDESLSKSREISRVSMALDPLPHVLVRQKFASQSLDLAKMLVTKAR